MDGLPIIFKRSKLPIIFKRTVLTELVGADLGCGAHEDHIAPLPLILARAGVRHILVVAKCLERVGRDQKLARATLDNLGRLVLIKGVETPCSKCIVDRCIPYLCGVRSHSRRVAVTFFRGLLVRSILLMVLLDLFSSRSIRRVAVRGAGPRPRCRKARGQWRSLGVGVLASQL